MLQGVTGVCGRKEDEFDVYLTLVILFKVWVLGLFWWIRFGGVNNKRVGFIIGGLRVKQGSVC